MKNELTEREKILSASLERRYGSITRYDNKKKIGGEGPGGRAVASIGKIDFKDTWIQVKRLLAYLKGEETRLILTAIMVIISTLASLGISYMLRPIINTYIANDAPLRGDLVGLGKSLLLMFALALSQAATMYIQSKLLIHVSQSAIKRLREDLFHHLELLPISYYDTHATGDIMSRFTNDIDNIGTMLSTSLVDMVSGFFSLIGTFCLMIYTSISLTLVTVVITPLIFLTTSILSKVTTKYFALNQHALGTINGYAEEMVSGAKVVKVFGHEKTAIEEFGVLNEQLRDVQYKALFTSGLMGPVIGNVGHLNYVCTTIVGAYLCIARGFDIGGITVFLGYTRQFTRPLSELGQDMASVFKALAGAKRVFAVLDEKREDAKEKEPLRAPFKGNLEFKNVDFGYNADKLVVKDVTFYAKPGQKIALVGSTGSGKTTIVSLINRFYDLNQGEINLDGYDIDHLKLSELRENIAYVLQETRLFSGTIRENIRYGRLDATDEEVEEAGKLSYAHSFISKLPQGYDTMVTEDGANLSQGQRQLLNIARAALSKAPVLILDEATSSVDTRTEKYIGIGMDRLMKDRTTIVIAHRLSTIRDANAIMVLEEGKIIERGNHDELVAQKGRYYELVSKMSKDEGSGDLDEANFT